MECLKGVPYQVPPIGLLVLGHRLPVHQYGNPNHSNNGMIYNSRRIDSLFLFQNCKVFSSSTTRKGIIELIIGNFPV